MTIFAAFILFALSVILFFIGRAFTNQELYRKFMGKYMKVFGVDVTQIKPTPVIVDPLKPQIMQGKFAGFIFMALAVYLFITAFYLLTVANSAQRKLENIPNTQKYELVDPSEVVISPKEEICPLEPDCANLPPPPSCDKYDPTYDENGCLIKCGAPGC